MLAALPKDAILCVSSHLLLWEVISLSKSCSSFKFLTESIVYGSFEQVKKKHYLQFQLLDQYHEWQTLHYMQDKYPISSHLFPLLFTRFVRRSTRKRKRVMYRPLYN